MVLTMVLLVKISWHGVDWLFKDTAAIPGMIRDERREGNRDVRCWSLVKKLHSIGTGDAPLVCTWGGT